MIRLAAVVVALCAGLMLADAKPAMTVSSEGFGPIRFGMTVEEVEKHLGVALVPDDYSDGPDCRYFTPAAGAFTGLAFMTSDRKVTRVDVGAFEDTRGPEPIETSLGAKIGDPEARVLKIYHGQTKVGPHFYGGLPDHYIRVLDAKGVTRMIFETRDGRISSFRSGLPSEVEYVEGCT